MSITGREVVLIDTGVANIASLVAAFGRLGRPARLSLDAREVREAEALVLPGVGAFAAGMARLREARLVETLRERIAAGRPLLAVCLGMQLLCESSQENPGVEGLGVVPAQVTRFPSGARVPQFGWNRVVPGEGAHLVEQGFAYFANSYRIARAPTGFAASESEHGGSFVAALERGALLGCQFHPELSGAWGQALLGRWLVCGGAPC
ncbi:MAG: imidazole glycerol phosphate synthase subunit HisH [Polyangia bacterium]|jgi:imidazole glycerol phosphate synthase glutamine amidotransferase subunit|nr:imidazole glycerol phosphate synthase subunit HisH [Polyangia bacterium]